MKVGINLVGVSYGGNRFSNWIYCLHRIKQRVINCWNDLGHDTKLYHTTYHSELDELLLKEYTPYKHQFFDYPGSDRRLTHKASYELLRGEDLDFVVTTRFDIIFNDNITKYNIDYNKLNVIFKEGNNHWETNKFTSDTLFMFPYNMLEDMIDIMQSHYDNPATSVACLHHTYERMRLKRGDDSVHFMTNDTCLSYNDPSNTHYTVIRYPFSNML